LRTREYMSLSLKYDKAVVSSFFPLLRQGFQVEAQMGRDVDRFERLPCTGKCVDQNL